jgi:transposase-like protein
MIQNYRPEKIFCKRRKISGFIVDETQIKVGKEYFFWIWIAIEPINTLILHIYLSAAERNMFIAKKFLHFLIKEYGKHQISTDMVVHGISIICL